MNEEKIRKFGKEVVEYCKQYEGTDKYDVVMLAIAKGYELSEKELEDNIKEQCLGFAEWIDGCMYTRITEEINGKWKYTKWTDGESLYTTEELFNNYLEKQTNDR